jgi:hypothetical protein
MTRILAFTINSLIGLSAIVEKKKSEIIFFSIGFGQILVMAINTYFISHTNWAGMILSQFATSYIWAINVNKIFSSGKKVKILYATGAAVGCIIGVLIAKNLTK